MSLHHLISSPKTLASIVGLLLLLTVENVISSRAMPEKENKETPSSNIATPTKEFLDSIGVVSTFPNRGQPLAKTVEMLRYGGFRWVRAGIEGLRDSGPTTIQTFLDLHRETGVRLSWGLGSGGTNVKKLLETGKVLAKAGALLAFEGNNEPNNWGITYRGEKGGGSGATWLPVAKLQRDVYQAVKSDSSLSKYPVWSISESGAERDDVGLQFLAIPTGAGTLMPVGTKYADYANVHNYIFHPNSPNPADNKTWDAADPTAASRVDGLYGNFGVTWRMGFQGYTQEKLDALPRVTTETGVKINATVTEEMQGLYLMNMYLAQFKRGYTYTSVYLLRDRTDEKGNQSYGFFGPDYAPRKAAIYLHNLTTILADRDSITEPGRLDYAIVDRPKTVHDLLLQRSDGTFQLIVWGERLHGEDRVTVHLGHMHESAKIYDPTTGIEPLRKLTGVVSLELAISDHPLVIDISGRRQ